MKVNRSKTVVVNNSGMKAFGITAGTSCKVISSKEMKVGRNVYSIIQILPGCYFAGINERNAPDGLLFGKEDWAIAAMHRWENLPVPLEYLDCATTTAQ